MDFTENDLVGTSRDERYPPMLRKTTSKIPSVRPEFNQLLEMEFKRHKLKEKMDTILEYAQKKQALTDHDMKEQYHEHIEEWIRRAIKYADRSCRTYKTKILPF